MIFDRRTRRRRSKRAIARKAKHFVGRNRFDGVTLAGIRFGSFASPSGDDDGSGASVLLYNWEGECRLDFWEAPLKISFCTPSNEPEVAYERFLRSLLSCTKSIRSQVENRLVDYYRDQLLEDSGSRRALPSPADRREVLNYFGTPNVSLEEPDDSRGFSLDFTPTIGSGYLVTVQIVDQKIRSVS